MRHSSIALPDRSRGAGRDGGNIGGGSDQERQPHRSCPRSYPGHLPEIGHLQGDVPDCPKMKRLETVRIRARL